MTSSATARHLSPTALIMLAAIDRIERATKFSVPVLSDEEFERQVNKAL